MGKDWRGVEKHVAVAGMLEVRVGSVGRCEVKVGRKTWRRSVSKTWG